VSNPHPSANAVALPRIPNRKPRKKPIVSPPLNRAQRPRRRRQVDLARSQTIDTTHYSDATMIAQERLVPHPHVQDRPVHHLAHHTP